MRNVSSESQSNSPAVVYADCMEALKIARQKGIISVDLPVRSMAPAILSDDTITLDKVDHRLRPQDITEYSDALLKVVNDVWVYITNDIRLDDAEHIALVTSRTIFINIQDQIFNAAILKEEDLNNSTLAVAVRHKTASMQRRFYFGVAKFLSESGCGKIVEIPADQLTKIEEPAPPTPPFIKRVSYLRMETLLFRIGMIMCRLLPVSTPRGGIFVLRENELLKETGAKLLMRGFGLYSLTPLTVENEFIEESYLSVAGSVRSIIEKRFDHILAPTVLQIMASEASDAVLKNIAKYCLSIPIWRDRISKLKRRKPKAVLTNMLVNPEVVGLRKVLQEYDIPLIAFQHGVTAEISRDIAQRGISFDNIGCDLAITFNAEMQRLCEQNPYGGAPAVSVGLPADYNRVKRRNTSSSNIWYVSTSLYQSNLGRLHRGLSDADIYLLEMALIDKVFVHLPYRIVYKPYPAHRYLDDDPLLKHAAKQDNIEIHTDRLDLRYVAHKARILLTAGASSTISRCLMSGRPTVFINSPHNMPLRDIVRQDFIDAMFVFDSDSNNFFDDLKVFLSQPIDEIERAWDARIEARSKLIKTFFSAPHSNPAARAADAVISKIGRVK